MPFSVSVGPVYFLWCPQIVDRTKGPGPGGPVYSRSCLLDPECPGWSCLLYAGPVYIGC